MGAGPSAPPCRHFHLASFTPWSGGWKGGSEKEAQLGQLEPKTDVHLHAPIRIIELYGLEGTLEIILPNPYQHP